MINYKFKEGDLVKYKDNGTPRYIRKLTISFIDKNKAAYENI